MNSEQFKAFVEAHRNSRNWRDYESCKSLLETVDMDYDEGIKFICDTLKV